MKANLVFQIFKELDYDEKRKFYNMVRNHIVNLPISGKKHKKLPLQSIEEIEEFLLRTVFNVKTK